jgi:hypothetical protein
MKAGKDMDSNNGDSNTLTKFDSLLREKEEAVSWIGVYSTAHGTKIEYGFLKNDAMGLTTLLSYYQAEEDGVPKCPLAMVSGESSLGRKLAIFYSAVEHPCQPQCKVDLSLGLNMNTQSMQTLAQVGRGDFYLGTLASRLQEVIREEQKGQKTGLDMTEGGKLKRTPANLRLLTGPGEHKLDEFENEVFQSNQIDIANLMLKYLEFEIADLHRWLLLVVTNGWLALTKLLMKWYPEIHHRQDEDGFTALMYASMNDHQAVVQLLIDKGAQLEVQDHGGRTALTNASQEGHQAVVQLLIDKGAQL